MDTATGEIIQVVQSGNQAEVEARLKDLDPLVQKVMTAEQVSVVNAERERTGQGKIEEIAKMPNPSCRRCHGRGHLGKDVKSDTYIKCVCVLTDSEAKTRRARVMAEEQTRRAKYGSRIWP